MRVLFISRKSSSSIGGLSRFFAALTENFPKPYDVIAPDSLGNLFHVSYKKIDVIHLCDATLLPIGILLKFFLRKPFVLTAHGLDLTYPNPFYQWFLSKTLPYADAIILDSHPAEILLDPFAIPKQKIHIINPGITVNQFRKSKPTKLPNLKEKIILLTVGNLVKRKGHAWFLQHVFIKLPQNFIYYIVGDGPERKTIENIIQKQNLEKRVFLFGKLTNQQLAYVFTKTDIYVCPNQKIPANFESFGIANGEAAAMGLPVIASSIDGIPELIKHKKNGLLVNPNPKAFLSALEILKTSKERNKFGKRAKIYTKKQYTWKKTVRQYVFVFEEVVGKN